MRLKRKLAVALALALGVAGGFGVLSGVVTWAAGHPFADVPLGVAVLLAFLYFKPYRACRWCRPGGLLGGSLPARLAGHKPKPKRGRRCWRCRGRKLTRRWGAWHVHKAKESLAQAWSERGAD